MEHCVNTVSYNPSAQLYQNWTWNLTAAGPFGSRESWRGAMWTSYLVPMIGVAAIILVYLATEPIGPGG